jgi:hypothetical protein
MPKSVGARERIKADRCRGRGRGNRNRTWNYNPKKLQRHQTPPKHAFAAILMSKTILLGLLQGDYNKG